MNFIDPAPGQPGNTLQPVRQSGFMLLWLLVFIALLGVGMAAAGTLWHTASQRDKERELLFVGDQYRRALQGYARMTPPQGQPQPESLEDLLHDPRFPHTVRHLRRLYPDPISGQPEWGLLRNEQGGIVGLHSLSDKTPYKTTGFPVDFSEFEGKTEYRQWVYAAVDAATQPQSAKVIPDQGSAPGGQPSEAAPPGSVRSPAQLALLACLQEKERATVAECGPLQGQARSQCHTQVFQRYLSCRRGN